MSKGHYIIKRSTMYCHYTQRHVNQEISFVETDEKKDMISTCTGIQDSCSDCLFLLGYSQARKEPEKKQSMLFIQISKTNEFL